MLYICVYFCKFLLSFWDHRHF